MSRPVPIRLRKRLSSPRGLGPNVPSLPPLAFNVPVRIATSVAADTLVRSDSAVATSALVADANDTVTRTDSAVALQIAVADAADTLSRTDSATASSVLIASATDTISRTDEVSSTTDLVAVSTDTLSRSDSATATSLLVAEASDTLSRSDSAVAAIAGGVIAAVAKDTLSRSDSAVAVNTPPVQFPTISGADPVRRRRKDEREDLLEVIRALSPTPAVADRVVKAVQRSTMAKLVAPAGVALHSQVLALPESLRAIVRQAIQQVENREQEEFLLLL